MSTDWSDTTMSSSPPPANEDRPRPTPGRDAVDPTDEGPRHALPDPAPASGPESSYGELFSYPPYSTEDAPMVIDVPEPAPAPPTPAAVPPAPVDVEQATEVVTCPECGTRAPINPRRRTATDFCQRCDFPLFWTPTQVLRGWDSSADRDSLRRLPGIAGATRLASTACPHCAELNSVSAQYCIRCGQPMHVAAPVPEPVVVAAPEPLPEPEPEPETVPWWVWVLVAAAVVGVTLLALWLAGVFG